MIKNLEELRKARFVCVNANSKLALSDFMVNAWFVSKYSCADNGKLTHFHFMDNAFQYLVSYYKTNIFFVVLGLHTMVPGFMHSSALRDYSWQAWGPHRVLEIKPRPVTRKANALHTVLLLWPLNIST